MRFSTTLLLGAAALMVTGPIRAQTTDGFTRAPAVAPRPGTAQAMASTAPAPRTAAQSVAPPQGAEAPAIAPAGAVNPVKATKRPNPEDTDAAPTTDAPAQAAAESPTPPVDAAPTQEAKAEPPKDTDADAVDALTGADKAVDSDMTDAIAATVNDESISDYEIRQRMALYLATSGLQKLTDEQKKRVKGQILDQMEAEKIQLQEARKKKITVSPVEVDKRINAMMAENHFTLDQLRTTLVNAGASEDALRAQITASIAWQKAVQDEYQDKVNVTPEQIDTEMARYAEGAEKAHFHVLEIFLPVDNSDQDVKVKKDADEIETQLHQGAPFALVARQFSQHPTAATGGDIGWVHEGQLAPELNQALKKMEAGQVSDPIRSTGGYYILALRERQEGLGTKIAAPPTGPTGPAGTLPLARMLLPIPPHAPKPELDNVMKVADQIRSHTTSCAALEQISKQMKGSVYMNLGDMKLAELSPQIQAALTKTQAGDVAEPFQSDAGIEIIARCDKRIPVLTAYTLPTRSQVEDQLFETQISTMARRYLRDLKRSANIQVRDGAKAELGADADVKVR